MGGLPFLTEASVRAHYVNWVEELPPTQTPAWLGLPSNAENVLLAAKAESLLLKVRKLVSIGDDEGSSGGGGEGEEEKEDGGGGGGESPAWMVELAGGVEKWEEEIKEGRGAGLELM